MNYAKIENDICVDAIACDDAKLAETLGFDVPLLPSFGIGDKYINNEWVKVYTEPEEEPEEEPEVEPKFVMSDTNRMVYNLLQS